MANFKKGILFLFLLQLKLFTYGQSRNTYHIEIASPGQSKATSSIRVNDIATTITTPPHLSYSTPQTFGINVPISPLTPNNTGGSVPAAIYGQQSVFAGPGPFNYVTGLIVEPDGTLYAANYGEHKINKVSPTGIVSIFAGPSVVEAGAIDGPANNARFAAPDALSRDAAGNIYVSDMGNQLIRKITPDGTVSTFAGNGSIGAADNAMGTLASFNTPRGMAQDAAGNIYLADQGNNLIRKISPSGAVTTVAGKAGAGFSNGNATTAQFNSPTAVGIDDAGNLYVSDSQNGAIRKITPDGTVSTIATGLNFPRELRADATGNIYVVEQNSDRVSVISPAGGVTMVATGFSSPIGLVLDGKGSLYVGSIGQIHKVNISGYTIDKTLPDGLSFNSLTGVISGTPTSTSPATNYIITAYNGGGSHSTTINIAVTSTTKKPSIITLPSQRPDYIDANNNYDPKGTSTNTETPIVYTSSNPAVVTITANGWVHIVGPGLATITATQAGNENYTDALPVTQNVIVTTHLFVDLPAFATKTVCSADFTANAYIYDTSKPVSYTSSNPGVATISSDGVIHITGAGSTVITISQNTTQQYYVSAQPKSQTLTVVLPVMPVVSIAANYASNCSGALVTFSATGQNAGVNPTYQWRVNNTTITNNNTDVFKTTSLNNGDKVVCTLINNDSPCLGGFPAASNAVTVSLTVSVTPVVSITASANYVFPGTTITFTAAVKNGSGLSDYQWYVNDMATGNNSPIFESTEFTNGDLVKCVVAPSNSCSLPAASQTLKVGIVSKVEIPNTFTPNADGINDTWFIKGLAGYPNCLVSVYNRLGQLMYRSKGYSADWDGRANGKDVPPSTYYYVIDLQFQNKVMSGYLTVIK